MGPPPARFRPTASTTDTTKKPRLLRLEGDGAFTIHKYRPTFNGDHVAQCSRSKRPPSSGGRARSCCPFTSRLLRMARRAQRLQVRAGTLGTASRDGRDVVDVVMTRMGTNDVTLAAAMPVPRENRRAHLRPFAPALRCGAVRAARAARDHAPAVDAERRGSHRSPREKPGLNFGREK